MIKTTIILTLLLVCVKIFAQQKNNFPNLIIITTDGLRWQEIFNGMDTTIANNPKFNEEDSLGIYKKYFGNRAKIFPFFWNTIAREGQLWGNRNFNNKMDNANPYWFSYPGYSELLCGFVDDSINSNQYTYNPHTTLLDFLNKQPAYKNKVAAFGAWHVFEKILNKPRATYPIFAAFNDYKNPKSKLPNTINKLNKEAHKPWDEDECFDVFTHNMALDYLKTQQPKVLYIGYGETDEWAHSSRYKAYLNAAHQFDAYVKEIWNFVQSSSFYKNNTILMLTTDHGRGHMIKEEWTKHNKDIVGANEIWFAVLGKNIAPLGERKQPIQLYQKQLMQTCASAMGLVFNSEHQVAAKIELK
jgi:hypothetical protein